MERRSGARAIVRNMHSVQRRFLAFVLAAAMIFTNVGANMNTAYAAGSSESVTFSMSGSQLVKAVEEAIADGNEITADDLDFTNGKIAEFEELLFGEGKIYEAFPDPEGGSMDAELRVFVRLPEDADDMYMVTGDEEIIFLYVNNGEGTISCTTEITRMDDGTEKVKKTKRVTVKSYEAAYGDEEVNIISKPVETPAPEETQKPSAEETTSPAETVNPEETTVPDENVTVPEETTVPEENTAAEESTSPDESTTAPEETDAADATTAAPEESQTEAQPEETTEAAEENTPETEAPETEAPKTESAEPVASIMRHYAPVVADSENSENSEAAPEAKEETEAPEPEKEEEPKGTETPEKEDAAEVTEATEATEEITDTSEAADPTESAQAPEESAEDTTAEADEETTVPDTEDTTPAESDFADSSESKADVPSEPEETVGTATSSTAEQTKEAPSEESHVSKAGTADLVGMGYCSTAKAYVTTINQLKALDDFDGYKVCYAVYPEASARIVEGLRGVEEGGTLTFGVKNQLGSAIDYVSVNDEIIEADAVVDNDNGSQTAWYSVPDIYEEQDVQVYMNETMAHPVVELEPIVMEDGVIIYISADEGVLPVGVTASAARVNEDVENAVKETAQADADGAVVSSVMAYDINLWLGDKLLDSDIWGGSKRVKVTFAGAPVQEQNAQSDNVEVMYVETVQDNDKNEKEKAAAQEIDITAADIVNVEAVGTSVDEASVSFEAKHFSIYAIVGTEYHKDSYTMYAGQTITLQARNASTGGTWTSSDPSIVSVTKSGTDWYPYALVHANDAGSKKVTITYSYYAWGSRRTQEFEITVKRNEVKAYFYVQRPGMDPGSLLDKDWKYVGQGNIDVSGIKNQYGTDMAGGKGHYSLDDPASRVITYPADANIKKVIADLYGVSVNDIDVEISYAPYKITYPMGWVDANGTGHDANKAVYHVDMTASVTTKEKATATYWLWDAGESGYQPVESYDVKIGDTTSPKKNYPASKTAGSVEYVFSGWYTDADRSQTAEFPYQVDKMANFYAKYIPNPSITVHYEAIGGGSVSPTKEHFKAYTENPKGSTGTTPSGYVFKGWFDNDEGAGEPISTDLKFTPSKPEGGWIDGMTFYAVWEGAMDTLTYDANKGAGTMEPSKGNVGGGVIVKENEFTRDGYYFAGWNTEADGTGAAYEPGETYTLTAGDDILFAVWKEVGTFKVWAYYPDINPDLSYGDWIEMYEDYGPDNAPLTYKKNGTQSGEDLTLDGVNEILAYSKAQTELAHEGAQISSVYLQYETDETDTGWSAAIYATLKDSKAIAFEGLSDEVFHEGKESRLHITYRLPRTVEVEYWKSTGTGYEQVADEGYKVGPAYVYAYDDINISETSTSQQDILKIVPDSLPGYSVDKAVYLTGDSVPTGTENALAGKYRVKDTRAVQRICILLEENEDVTLTYVAGIGGSVNPESETVAPATGIAEGSEATPLPGYHFVNWTVNDREVGTTPVLDTQEIDAVAKAGGIYKATTFKANFEEDADVTINYVATAGGNVSVPSETLAPVTDDAAGSTASSLPGYHFVNWTNEKGIEVSKDLKYVPARVNGLNVAATYTANFAEDSNITILYRATEGGTVKPSYETLAPVSGNAAGSVAEALPGYHFVKWTNTAGDVVGEDPAYVPAKINGMNVAAIYTAHFEEDADVTIKYEATTGGSVDPESETLAPVTDDAAGSEAKALPGYHFVNWTNADGEQVSTDLNYVPAKVNGLNVAATYTAHFEEDEDVTIEYRATAGGNVDPGSETLAPVTDDAAGSTAAALPGYHFVKWTNAAGEEVSTDLKFVPAKVDGLNVAAVYTAHFEEDADVTIKYEATTGGSVDPESETLAPVTGVAAGSEAKALPGYHFVNWTNAAGEEVGTDLNYVPAKVNGLNVAATYTAHFEEDESVTVNYVADIGGTVNRAEETLAPATGKPEGAKAAAEDGYVFTHWTNEAGEKVGVDETFIPKKNSETQVFEADTYTAHFAMRGDLSYRVEYYYDGVLGEVDTKDNVTFGTEIPFTTVPRDFNGRNYIFESANGPRTAGSDSNANLVKVYYVLDDIGGKDPQTPDGIPDKYQITFTYVAGNNGTVSGTTSEVHTIQQITRDPETNEIIKVGSVTPAHPRADVTTGANSGYTFNNWSIDGNAGKTYINTDAVKADSFVQDTTFIANFRSTGGSGGSSGGGGGSTSGGAGRYTQTDGGPGVVSINPQDVPLAPLPETPFTTIEDDEVPLAPLPKTGQGYAKSTLTMVMSGILLMLTAISKKRKEEES